MFRRRAQNLPEDPKFGWTFKELGYAVNKDGKIKSIQYPDDDFRFFITNHDRVNEMQREAMHDCIRREVTSRLAKFSIPQLQLPTLTPTPPPPPHAHLPIYATTPSLLSKKKRIIVLISTSTGDLGILSYRVVTHSGGISSGTVLSMIQSVHDRSAELAAAKGTEPVAETPGIIVLNPGQLLYSHKHRKALTQTSWLALPRKSAVHPPIAVSETHNRVPANATAMEHVDFVFSKLLDDPGRVQPDAELYLIGLVDGGDLITKYIQDHPQYIPRIAALATTAPVPTTPATCPLTLSKANKPFLDFLAQRSRTWCLSTYPLNTPLANPTPPLPNILEILKQKGHPEAYDEIALMPMVSGGHEYYGECVIPEAWGKVLDWFEQVAFAGGAGYAVPGDGEGVGGGASGDEGVKLSYRNPILEVSDDMLVETLSLQPHMEPAPW